MKEGKIISDKNKIEILKRFFNNFHFTLKKKKKQYNNKK